MRVLVTILLSVIATAMYSQYRFDHLSIKDGLSQNSVNDIYQDSEGYMWFATQDGLNRFDGYDFTKYMTDGQLSVSDNFVWDIKEDREGSIWVASRNGATRLNWKKEKTTHFFRSATQNSTNFQNQLGGIVSLNERLILPFSVGENYLIEHSLLEDTAVVYLGQKHRIPKSNRLLEVILNGAQIQNSTYLIMTDGIKKDDQFIPFPTGHTAGNFQSEILEYKDGFFLATMNGLLYFNTVTKSFTLFNCLNVEIFDLLWADSNKIIWVATKDGIIFFDPNTQTCTGTINSSNSNLSSESISSLYQSKDGIIWVGTANGGLNMYDPKKDRFKFIKMSAPPVWSSLLTDSSLFIGANNNLYYSKLKGNLTSEPFAEYALKSDLKSLLEEGIRISAIESISSDQVLLGTTGDGLLLFDTHSKKILKKIRFEKEGNANLISAINKTASFIWITTHNGLFKLDHDLNTLKVYSDKTGDGFHSNYFLASYKDHNGNLWVGSNTGIATIYQDSIKHIFFDEQRPSKSPAFNFVTGFFEDAQGRIWMSTFGGGVSCLDVETGAFFHLKKADGLANNVCASILGNEKYMFVGTNEGLSRIDIKTLKITNYTTSDGLLANEFAINAAFNKEEEFLFGTIDGLVVFSSESLSDLQLPLKPIITKLSINYKEENLSRFEQFSIDLYPKDQIFSLEFSDLSFRNRDKTYFEYKMVGFNENWIRTNSANRRATYSLSPGDYTFQVRTVNGSLKSEPTMLSVIVHPAFYNTWWFLTLLGISLLLATFFVSRYYSHQLLKKKLRELEVQQKIQNERERISRDLHDNVGSQITYIASSLDNLSRNGSFDEMKELGEFTRDTMRQLRETIWVINHDEVSLEELKSKVVDYLSEILKYHPEIRHQVLFPASEISLNPSRAINIFRIIQEAVNNAVKHAQPNNIYVQLEYGETCRILIKDDGIGFDGNDKVGHFGLINMRTRVQELEAQLNLTTSKNEGTIIAISEIKIGQMT
jgi:signal transduction histidine kinase/ligand-binding sensor domain-containing protein